MTPISFRETRPEAGDLDFYVWFEPVDPRRVGTFLFLLWSELWQLCGLFWREAA